MSTTKYILCFFLFCYLSPCVGSDQIILDSLKNYTFEDIRSYYENTRGNQAKEEIAESYFRYAKKTSSDINLANAYQLLIDKYSETPRAFIIADSIIHLSKNYNLQNYPAIGYYYKGSEYYYAGRMAESIENILIARKFAKQNKNYFLLQKINKALAFALEFIGEKDKAIDVYESNYNQFRANIEWISKDPLSYSNTIYLLALVYYNNENYNDAMPLVREGLNRTYNLDKQQYSRLLHLYGLIKTKEGFYNEAIDSIKKGLINMEPFHRTYACGVNALGKAYLAKGNSSLALTQFNKVDSLYQLYPSTIEWAEESYNILNNFYKNKNDYERAHMYLEKKNTLAAKLSNEKIKVANLDRILNQLDEINLKDDNINSITQQINNYRILLFGIIAFLIVLISLFLYEKKDNQQKLIKKLKPNDAPNTSRSTKPYALTDSVNEDLLAKLIKFENSNEFLNNACTLQKLAAEFQTNTSYLSKLINKEKEQNFSNYINGLRIKYTINQLKDIEKFKHYTVQALARESGFKNSQTFVRSFQKNIGITPNEYLTNLRRDEANGKSL